jgi:NTP pyrophosphatase (non-canonical NTP hydrolase)
MSTTEVLEKIQEMVLARDWSQFHSAENLAKSISIEAAELLECYQWSAEADPRAVREELADVLTYCYLLAHQLVVDPEKVILDKLQQTNIKYPVEKSRGKSDKYDRL